MDEIQGTYKGIKYTTTQSTIDASKEHNIDLVKEIKNAIDEVFVKNEEQK